MRGAAVGQVIASRSPNFPVGSYALGNAGWTELAVVKDKHLEKMQIPKNGKVTDALGVLGEARASCALQTFTDKARQA